MLQGIGIAVALYLNVVAGAATGAGSDAGSARVDPETGTQTVVSNSIWVLLPLRHRSRMLSYQTACVSASVRIERRCLLDANTLDYALLLVRQGWVGIEEGVQCIRVRFLI